MFNRKLKNRLKSLEDFLGVCYSPADSRHDCDSHLADEYGVAHDLEKMRDEFRKKNKDK